MVVLYQAPQRAWQVSTRERDGGRRYARAMGDEESTPHLTSNHFANAVGPRSGGPDRDKCRCVGHSTATRPSSVSFHADRQDTDAAGWRHLLALIDEAVADGRTEFRPFVELSAPERRQIVTLPPSIAKLTAVEHLVLYGTNLVRIPPEIANIAGTSAAILGVVVTGSAIAAAWPHMTAWQFAGAYLAPAAVAFAAYWWIAQKL